MVSKAAERSSNVGAVTLPASIDTRISLWIFSRAVSVEWNFLYADWYWLDVFELFICEFSWFTTTFSRTLERKLRFGHWPVILHAILIEGGFLQKGGETWADLKCEGKEPSVSDKLIIDVIGVIQMSMQSFTRLVGIGSKSEDLHATRRTRWRTSSAVTQLRFCRTFLVSGGFNTRECELDGKEERITEILLMENKLNVFAKVAIEEWSGRCILGQRCKILLSAFHNDP